MSDRRRLLMQLREEGSTLPEGYYPCEYIESDGQQYINTRSEWNNKCRLVVDAEVSSRGCLFGVGEYGGDDDAYIYELSFYENSLTLEYGIQGGSYTFAGAIGTRRVYDWNKDTLFINDSKYITFNTSYNRVYNAPTLLAFASYDVEEDLDVSNYVSAKLYACQMYNYNGELLRDYIPCFSATDGKFGLYDRVSKTFFGSETTIDFKGKLIVPEGYSGVEYIYGDGNAFIDTDVTATNNTRVQMDMSVDELKTQIVFGSGSTTGRVYFQAYLNTSKWSCDFGTQSPYNLLSASAKTRYTVELANGKFAINGSTIATPTSGTFDTQHSVYFMCSHRNDGNYLPTKGSIYFAAIWEKNTLVRLFAPCINSSNVYGLYDLVNDKFYQSVGTSQFGEIPVVYDFDYTGGEQSVLLKAGTYKLETWGAQGGDSNKWGINGGKGGYSIGTIKLSQSTTVYINIGGKGQGNGDDAAKAYTFAGGYNGGGDGGSIYPYINNYAGGGGGATHIATKSGVLNALENYKDTILIVAGGGGGAGGCGGTERAEFGQTHGEGGIGGGIGGGRGQDGGEEYEPLRGYGGAAGSNNWAGSGGSGGNPAESDWDDDGWYVSGPGGGGGGGYYAGGGGGSGSIRALNPSSGKNGNAGGFGVGGKGGNSKNEEGYSTTSGGGGGGGSGYLAPSLTSASSNAGQRSGHGYARITKI